MANARGIDVSVYQGDIDWPQVVAGGIEFAFAKASEGTTSVDKKFAANWAGMEQAGLPRGAYHFFRTSSGGAAQAQHFIDVVGNAPGELPPVCDVETGSPQLSEVQAWLDTVEQHYNVRPMVYASLSFASDKLSSLGAYPLWVAEYNSHQAPDVPRGWTDWTFWQHSDRGSVPGINGAVDLDVHNGPLVTTGVPNADEPQPKTPAVDDPPPQPAEPPSVNPAPTPPRTYTVVAGDTLPSIADKLGVDLVQLAAINNLIDPADVVPGLVLTLP